jgi:hypothetical protein
MAQFMYLYRGPDPSTDATPDQAAERAAGFGAWLQQVGSALVDIGRPFGPSGAVRDDGGPASASDLIGYTIVEADDLESAKALTHGLPFLAKADGSCTVEIFELLPM